MRALWRLHTCRAPQIFATATKSALYLTRKQDRKWVLWECWADNVGAVLSARSDRSSPSVVQRFLCGGLDVGLDDRHIELPVNGVRGEGLSVRMGCGGEVVEGKKEQCG